MKAISLLTYVLTLIAIPIFLIYLGWGQIHNQLQGEFTQHFGSIEVSYIQMARFIETSLPQFAWQPRWYLGYPMSVIYTPVVPIFEYVARLVAGWSYAHAYRVLTGVSFIGALVSLFFFVKVLLKNTAAGFVAAIVLAVAPSIIALLYPEVANDRFGINIVEPRRFTILVRWGEGPHIVSLFLLPLAGLFWIKFIRSGNKWSLLGVTFFTTLVALTNSVGTWGLLIVVFALLFGEIVEHKEEWLSKILRVLLAGSISVGLVAFWFNPLFLSTFFAEGGGAAGRWRDAFPWGWLIGFAVLLIYFFLSNKLFKRFAGMTAVILYFGLMFWFVNTYYASPEDDKVELVPQVLRLNAEVDVGFSMLAGGVIALLGSLLIRKNYYAYLGLMVLSAIIAGTLGVIRQQTLVAEVSQFALPAEAVGKDLTKTGEYDVAKTLETKVSGGERVFAPGNYGFFLNYFTDVPQIRGALYQSEVHHWPEHIYYQVTNSKDPQISLDWLKIANIGWLVYSGPREMYHDFKVPAAVFDQVLTRVDERSGDIFFKVPLKNTSLAKAVPKSITTVNIPINAIDAVPIADYVSKLEASNSELTYSQNANGIYTITGGIDHDELILVQSSYVAGWQAKDAEGRGLKVTKDPLGFILIEPHQIGEQKITLSYHTPFVVWLGRLGTLMTVVFLGFLIFKVKKPILVAKLISQSEVKQSEDE